MTEQSLQLTGRRGSKLRGEAKQANNQIFILSSESLIIFTRREKGQKMSELHEFRDISGIKTGAITS